MNTKILDQLEFNKVKDQFTEYLQTEQAKAELRDLVPMTNPERIQNQFTEIQEMAEILVEHHGFAIGSLRDISEPLRRLELDADLNICLLYTSSRRTKKTGSPTKGPVKQ